MTGRLAELSLKIRKPSPAARIALIVGAVLLAMVLPPLIFLASTSLHSWSGLRQGPFSFENYRDIVAGGEGFGLAKNSVIYAAGSTAVALVVGAGLAWLVERTDTPLKALVYVGAFVALAVPGVVNVIGWILLLGPDAGMINVLAGHLGLGKPFFDVFSMGGMILVEALSWTPVVFLLMVTPFKFMDPSLEEAAMMSGATRRQVFFRITLRLALPSALAALILSLIRTLESFETPALIGIPGGVKVLTTEIYLQIKSGLIAEYGVASAYAVVLIVFVMFLLRRYNRQTARAERFATVTGKGFRPSLISLGRWRYVGGAVCVLVFVIVMLPLAALLWASLLPYYQQLSFEALGQLTLGNYPDAFYGSGAVEAIVNTLIVGVVSAFAVMVISFLSSWVMVRTKVPGRGILDLLASMPLVIPGVVAGIAVLRTYIDFPLPVYGTIWILVIAFAMRYVPYGMRYSHAGIVQLHKDLEESAEVSGASLFVKFRRIVIPLTLPSLAGGFIFTLLNSSSQLAIPLLLSGPDSRVISVSIFDLYQNGEITQLAAFSVAVTAVIVALAYVAYRFSRSHGI